jgi:DNA-binding transcriptional ArsR family regulator
MNEQLRAISELDRVIHEPGRLMIIGLLAVVKECDFLYLLHETEMNKGNLSSHLARLEEARYVEIEKTYRGKVPQTLLRLTRSGRVAFGEYRKGLKAAFLTAHAIGTRPADMKKLKSPLLESRSGCG